MLRYRIKKASINIIGKKTKEYWNISGKCGKTVFVSVYFVVEKVFVQNV
jgi:hypothetical protein